MSVGASGLAIQTDSSARVLKLDDKPTEGQKMADALKFLNAVNDLVADVRVEEAGREILDTLNSNPEIFEGPDKSYDVFTKAFRELIYSFDKVPEDVKAGILSSDYVGREASKYSPTITGPLKASLEFLNSDAESAQRTGALRKLLPYYSATKQEDLHIAFSQPSFVAGFIGRAMKNHTSLRDDLRNLRRADADSQKAAGESAANTFAARQAQ